MVSGRNGKGPNARGRNGKGRNGRGRSGMIPTKLVNFRWKTVSITFDLKSGILPFTICTYSKCEFHVRELTLSLEEWDVQT